MEVNDSMLHLAFGALLLFVAIWAVLDPPHSFFWLLSLPAKEWGWVGALCCLPLLWPGWIAGPAALLGAFLALGAAILFLIPLFAGAGAAARVPAQMEAAFGPAPAMSRPPFAWKDLVLGVRRPRAALLTRTFAEREGTELQLDLTRPAGGPAPVVVVIHGGSWKGGDRTQLSALNHYLTSQGYATAAISYRFAPQHHYPEMLADVAEAIAYLKRNAAELGVDASQIVLLGRSAGGQLAVAAAFALKDPAIKGAVAYYGPFSLEWGYRQHCKVLDGPGTLRAFLGGSPEEVPDAYRAASPLHLAESDSPPVLMLQGTADTMVSPLHAVHLVERLKAKGVAHCLIMVPQATHGSDLNFSGPFGQIGAYAVERFLRSVLR